MNKPDSTKQLSRKELVKRLHEWYRLMQNMSPLTGEYKKKEEQALQQIKSILEQSEQKEYKISPERGKIIMDKVKKFDKQREQKPTVTYGEVEMAVLGTAIKMDDPITSVLEILKKLTIEVEK